MRNETRELLGFKVQVTGICDTLAEVINAVGSEEGVVNDVNNQTLAHSHFTILRRKIVAKLEELSGVKREGFFEGEGDKKKWVIDEKDAAYIARLEGLEDIHGKKGEEWLKLQEGTLSTMCAGVSVDYKPGTRGAGGSATPAKKYLAYYDQMVAEDKLDLFCERHGIDSAQDEDALKVAVANKVKELLAAAQAEAMKKALDV